MFHNLPILQKKQTYFGTNLVKEILYEDIFRSLDYEEAETILKDTYA